MRVPVLLRRLPRELLLRVRPDDDVRDLVKEQEVLTGHAGRRFLVLGAERLHYRVGLRAHGLEITRLDDAGRPVCTQYVAPGLWAHHTLGQAQRCACLYTPVLSR